jgi:hypothetical protein
VAAGAAFILWKTGAVSGLSNLVGGSSAPPTTAATPSGSSAGTVNPGGQNQTPAQPGDQNAAPPNQTTVPQTSQPPANQSNNLPVATGGIGITNVTENTPGGKVRLPIAAVPGFNPNLIPTPATAQEATIANIVLPTAPVPATAPLSGYKKKGSGNPFGGL